VKRSAPYLSNDALDRELAAVVAREDTATAVVLDHIAEYDARRLYRPAGYPSMFAYCVGKLRRSEEAAYKRIRAARVARRFPAIFDAVADGRLHLTGVVLLAPHLTEHTAEELMAAASHKTAKEIEQLLAERFPRPDIPALVRALPEQPSALAGDSTAPGPTSELALRPVAAEPAPAQLALRPVQAPSVPPTTSARSSLKPLAPQRFAVQFTMSQSAHDKLRYVQELLSHQMPTGDIAQVFERALDALIPELEKQKFAATSRPRRRATRPGADPRHIPAAIQRAVWERDGGQCTFVSQDGHRCEARKFLQFDHVLEVARGGEASVEGIRLLCDAHNQHQAERTFGAEFMRHKRITAAEARGAARETAAAGGSRVERAECSRPSQVGRPAPEAILRARWRGSPASPK
jgi:5-methylcytosine-specific restriction endonuclease McrA